MSEIGHTRLANFEVLRSLAMLMVVIWHSFFYICGAHPFPTTATGISNYILSELLVILCNAHVDVFILVSGYFLLGKSFNTKRVLSLWFQVFFYSFAFTVLGWLIFANKPSWDSLRYAFFPLTNDNYWFFTRYIGLVVLCPFLSKAATALSKVEYRYFLIALIVFCCTLTYVIPLGNTMGAAKGYSLLWFIALFFWGGYFRRFGSSLDRRRCLRYFFATALLVALFCFGKAVYRYISAGTAPELELLAYNGFAFPLAVFLFLVFSKSSCDKGFLSTILKKVSPFSFGVYICSEHFVIRPLLWETGVPWRTLIDTFWFIPTVIVFCILVFFACAGIDLLRARLFDLMHVSQAADNLGKWLTQKINPLISRL